MKTTSVSIDPVTDKRFELVRPLGEGASGAVFLALDRETGEHVALKKLFKLDQKSVLRFKREFRSLADIHHPNLIKLYDLHRGQEAWFITMEYVSGKDFRQKFGAEATLSRETMQAVNDNDAPPGLLPVFYDLACGVNAIHRAGMLHRDLKPSNALISDGGRVVVLDFGLVREIENETQVTQDGTVAGTPAYMPPEQAMGAKLSEASDWYAFGVMLYEAISGVLPIDGKNITVLLERKLNSDPRPLRTGAPPAVLDLCMGLLSRDPDQRPPGARVLEILAVASGGTREPTTQQEHPLTIEPLAHGSATTLFGRDSELAQLRKACEDQAQQSSRVVHVRGTSGSGKSTLVEHFLDDAASEGLAPPIVLRSRCYEREAMPFKALDGVMDALVSYLAELDDITCAHLLPTDVADLARLFPVLERLGAVQRLRAARRTRRDDDSQTRRRAEQALRALVKSTAGHRRLLLWIDDLQWGDLDSASVLRDWLEQPLEAPVFIVLSYRSEEIHTSSSLTLLLDQPEQTVQNAQLTIDLDPLQPSDVRTLCMHRLAKRLSAPEAMIERIVLESHGNPFLAQQLTAIAEAKLARRDTSLDGLSMEALVQNASAFLGESARALLNVLAIAGRPLHPQLALSVAGVFSAGRAHIHTLRGLRLVRTREVGNVRLLEVYHDRVREVVQSGLSADESERIHADLLKELQTQGRDDHDWLHTLALGAGKRDQAFRHGLLAAERASESLAFERATELYSKCLVLFNGEMELYQLWMKMALAQAYCRRGYEAAKAYLSASEHAPAEKRTELLQLAASHLLRSGRFDEGERIVQQVLDAHKLHVPKSQAGLLAALAWEHGRIALRKLDVPENRSATSSDRTQLGLLYGTLSIETQMHAPLRSALFQVRALRLTLDYGDARQLARVLCLSATVACVSGTQRAARRSEELLQRAEQLFKRHDSQEVPLELLSARAICAQFVGRLDQALEPSNAVERITQNRSSDGLHGDYYYKFTVQMVRISVLQSLGRLSEARQALREHVARARATDNLAAILQVTMNRAVDEQAFEMCSGSRARLDAEYKQLPQNRIGILNVAHVMAVMRTACTTRDFDWAFERVDEFWEDYQRSVVHHSAFIACLAHGMHARLLLNHHVETGASGDVEPLVRKDVAQLERLPPSIFTETASTRVRARVAYLRGDRERAIQLLRASLVHFDATLMRQEIAHDRYALGLLVGGAEGAQLVAAAGTALREYGVSDPEASMRAYVPELMPSKTVPDSTP